MNFITNITNRVQKNESGQGTLEFACAAIILLAITFGCIDFGRAVYAKSTIQAASQEAVRAAIVHEDATNAVHTRMVGLNADSVVVAVTNAVDSVEVTVSYDFKFVTPLMSTLFGGSNGTIELTSVASMIS